MVNKSEHSDYAARHWIGQVSDGVKNEEDPSIILGKILSLVSTYKSDGNVAHELQKSPNNSVLVDFARQLLLLRRRRSLFLDSKLFGEPAWDMMLDLFVAHEAGKPVSVSSLSVAAAVPSSTAFRVIANLTKKGVFLRQADLEDGRRNWITLSPTYMDKMRQLLQLEITRIGVNSTIHA